MRFFLLTCLTLIFLSCGKEKTIYLPEITASKTTKISDVSAAYLFYNETAPDSVELNRKNLIGTTNWLVNVDKRLTLKQVVPSIIMLQNKKRHAQVHKNETARTYYTCNNVTAKNLGFIDFTDVVYHSGILNNYFKEFNKNSDAHQFINIKVHTLDSISIEFLRKDTSLIHSSNNEELLKHITANYANEDPVIIFSGFNKEVTFQDYITFKSNLLRIDIKNMTISTDEFIFN